MSPPAPRPHSRVASLLLLPPLMFAPNERLLFLENQCGARVFCAAGPVRATCSTPGSKRKRFSDSLRLAGRASCSLSWGASEDGCPCGKRTAASECPPLVHELRPIRNEDGVFHSSFLQLLRRLFVTTTRPFLSFILFPCCFRFLFFVSFLVFRFAVSFLLFSCAM